MASTHDDQDQKVVPPARFQEDENYVFYNTVFTKRLFRKLQALAQMKGVTIEQALGDAIDLSKRLNDEREEGNKILVARKDKKLFEVMAL